MTNCYIGVLNNLTSEIVMDVVRIRRTIGRLLRYTRSFWRKMAFTYWNMWIRERFTGIKSANACLCWEYQS